MKEISIIVPCYNVSLYIEQCFNSIVSQLEEDYEVIFINDGSTDNTGGLLENLKSKSNYKENIHIIHQDNKGLSETRNVGIDLSTGVYICFIDGDDFINDNYFRILINVIINSDLGVLSYNRVFSNNILVRSLGLSGWLSGDVWKRKLLGLVDDELSDPSQADSLVMAWCKIFKSKIIKDNKIYFVDTKIIGTEDLLFNLEYSQYINNVLVIDEPLYQYRKDNITSLTSTYKNDFITKWSNKYKYIKSRISITSEDEIQAFSNRLALSIIGLGLNEIKNPKGFKAIKSKLKSIISENKYKVAIKQLDLKYMPIHWKVFFLAAKTGNATVLYVLIKCIAFIIYRKNK